MLEDMKDEMGGNRFDHLKNYDVTIWLTILLLSSLDVSRKIYELLNKGKMSMSMFINSILNWNNNILMISIKVNIQIDNAIS